MYVTVSTFIVRTNELMPSRLDPHSSVSLCGAALKMEGLASDATPPFCFLAFFQCLYDKKSHELPSRGPIRILSQCDKEKKQQN